MKYRYKYALAISITGLCIIGVSSVIYYYHFIGVATARHLHFLEGETVEIANFIDRMLIEKAKTVSVLGHAPILLNTLAHSNSQWQLLDDTARQAQLEELNTRWMQTENPADPFIQTYLDNPAARYLKDQQARMQGEYGEVFLTNKYGALTAATAKLTTLAHAHKYWWRGAYHQGRGLVFFDDRGYDDSVGDYVLGVVVPLRREGKIIGVLKCNLRVLGAISAIFLDKQAQGSDKTQLARSGGLIIYEKGQEPLSTRLADALRNPFKDGAPGAVLLDEPPFERFAGFSPVRLTLGIQGYAFGGSSQSIDHQKGNQGELWWVVKTRPKARVRAIVTRTAGLLFLIGLALSAILAVIALFMGRRMARPIQNLADAARKIGQGQFDKRIEIQTRDELGELAHAFNHMAVELQRTTASRKELEGEIAERKQVEVSLHKALEDKKTLMREIHHRVKNNMQVISALLRMHGRRADDAALQNTFNDCQARITAMALIHEALYESEDLARIDFRIYLKRLCRHLNQVHEARGKGVTLMVDHCDVTLDMDQGVAVGMLIAELVANAFKHAFEPGQAGAVTVGITNTASETIELTVADDGRGLPPDFDIEKPNSLGLRLVTAAVTRELGGTIKVAQNSGTRFTIQFNSTIANTRRTP